MPDITTLGNCEGFRPSAAEIEAGTSIATDFKAFEGEINPYTNKAWKEDWLNDQVRLARCQEQGAVNEWTCQTSFLEMKMIQVNWDILNELGITTFPTTVAGLLAMSDQINASGKYVAWDNKRFRYWNYRNNLASLLAMDVYEGAGGDPNDLAHNPFDGQGNPTEVEAWCTRKLWISEHPSLKETMLQGQKFVEVNGGAESFFDETREAGQQFLNGQAAMWWRTSSDDEQLLNQAIADGTYKVANSTLEYFPDVTSADLIDGSTPISFNGEWFVEFGGQGDAFAPVPGVRASGADANVDLIVRDFLQYMSSAYGQQAVASQGLIPVNPDSFDKAPEQWVKAINDRVPDNAALYQNATQPPGGFLQRLNQWDPEKTEEAWLRGEMDFDTFAKKADENITREGVKRLKENLAQYGLTELPQACQEWDS
jgi:hypothetical protein